MSSLRVLVDLDSHSAEPEGKVTDDEEAMSVPFSGWLELMQIVERRLADQAAEGE